MSGKESRKERERRTHREEIEAAACSLFVQKGFEQTTVAEIAEAAEFSVGTLYNFFKDKEELYRSIVLRIASEIHEAVTAALGSPGTEIQRLERFIEAQTALLAKHAAVGRFYFQQGMGMSLAPTSRLDRELRDMNAKTLEKLQSIFRSGIRRKTIVRAKPLVLALALEALVNSFIPVMVEKPDAFKAEEMATDIKRIFFDQVRL